MRVPFSYLDRQFDEVDLYLEDLKKFVKTGDFTLGKELEKFESRFAKLCGVKEAIGVGTGTDALAISLKMLGIGPGDEVITTPMTFIATVGAIVMTGATPVFVDSEDGYVIDPAKIEEKITARTKALLPVHYTGNVAEMGEIMRIAKKHRLFVVEDAAQAIAGEIEGKKTGSMGITGAFSFHPLKNLNVWADGGMITTFDENLARKIRLYRNHGLINRDEVEMFGSNCRFDTLQAVIANRLFDEVDFITDKRIAHAKQYDRAFADLHPWVEVPARRAHVKHVYHLYIIRAKRRNQLLKFLNERGVEAKIHYPIPVHLQKASAYLGYKRGDFPVCEEHCDEILTLPAHQHLTQEEILYTIASVQEFYQTDESQTHALSDRALRL